MRQSATPVYYLVGTPKGRLSRFEKELTDKPWERLRDNVSVKLLEDGEEIYVYAQSENRIKKERAIRKRRLRRLLKELAALSHLTFPFPAREQHITGSNSIDAHAVLADEPR